MVTGALLIGAGLILSNWMPINKKLWTDSYCVFMAGLDFLVYAGFLWTIDALGWRKPARPFLIVGMNAITIYALFTIVATTLDYFSWTSAARASSLRMYLSATLLVPILSSLLTSDPYL